MASVLVLNDEPDLLEACRMILEDGGHRAVVTTDASRAVDLAASMAPNVILLDWIMPGANGDEVLRRLRNNDATADIPVVIMSALADGAERSRRIGADAFLAKPFDADQLIRMVEEVAGRGPRST